MPYSFLTTGVDIAEAGSSSEVLEGNTERQTTYYGFIKFWNCKGTFTR